MIQRYSEISRKISPADQGWIYPEGKFYNVYNYNGKGFRSHFDIADAIVKDQNIPVEKGGSSLRTLLKEGWVRVIGINQIPPVLNLHFEKDIDNVKSLVRKIYPDFFGNIYADIEGEEEIFFQGNIDDFFKWSGNQTVMKRQ